MTSEHDVETGQIGVILREWRDSGRSLYAVVFDERGMQVCAGQVSSVDDEKAMISDSFVDLRVRCHAGHTERSANGTLTCTRAAFPPPH